jgi:hypothetical protein
MYELLSSLKASMAFWNVLDILSTSRIIAKWIVCFSPLPIDPIVNVNEKVSHALMNF